MKRLSLGAAYEWGLLAVLFVIVLHAPLAVWLGTVLPDIQVGIKAWKEVLLSILSVIAIVLVTRRKAWRPVLSHPAVWLSLLVIAVHLAMAILIGGDVLSVVAGLMIDLRFIVLFILMYVLIFLRPNALRRVVKTIVAGAAVAVGFGILQITVLPDDILRHIGYVKNQTIAPYITIDQNPDFVRINSTLRGPNPLGALMVIYAALAVAYLMRSRIVRGTRGSAAAMGTALASAAVLFASYSRSAYVALVAALAVLLATARLVSSRMLVVGTVLLCWAGGLLLLAVAPDWVSNVILHENPNSTVVAKSNHGHIESLEVGLSRLQQEPFGRGIGSTGSASLYDADKTNDIVIENYYFFVAHEAGWAGLAAFAGLFACIMMYLWRARADWRAVGLFAGGVGLAIIGLLLPVWADETVAFIWWGSAGAIIAATSGIIKHDATRPRQQKTTRAA